jgi:hypothetical protein
MLSRPWRSAGAGGGVEQRRDVRDEERRDIARGGEVESETPQILL